MQAYQYEKDKRYTYEDYSKWDDSERWELIDGVPYAMAPAPSQFHQEASVEMLTQIHAYLKGKACKVFHAPFDVRLNAEDGDDTIVQPDLLIVCDQSKLDGKCCKGAPDMAVEILSPSTSSYDKLQKFNAYLRAGVREYWIVDPIDRTINVYLLRDGEYYARVYGETDDVPVSVLSGLSINAGDVFPGEEEPKMEEAEQTAVE